MRRAGGALRLALAALATTVANAVVAPVASAQENRYSKYEQQTVDLALKDLRAKIDPAPEGKIVEDVVIRRLDVFEERDPLPHPLIKFLDWLHATSLPFTIEREVLLHRGDKYAQDAVDETARNLRSLPQLSVVICVPIEGSAPDRVKLLVITKDIWSLRLNSDIRVATGGLERLLLQPSEENLGGIHHRASLLFLYEPATLTFGAGYTIPRIADSRLGLSLSGNVIVNKHTGHPEGSYGSFSYGQPLYSTKAKWAYLASLSWLEETTRRFIGVDEATFDATVTPEDDKIPYEYSSDILASTFELTRSFGTGIKHDVTVGAEAKRSVFRAHQKGFDPAAIAEFEARAMPVSDTRVYPFVQYETYSTSFMSAHDVDTLGLEENFRLGHVAYVKLYPVLEALASSRSYMGVAAGLSYTVKLGDGFGRVYAEDVTEASPDRLWDGSISAGLRLTSPRAYIGRLVFDGTVFDRYANYLNHHTSIGGSGRLRGYPTDAFIGESAFAWNLKYRSRPLEIFTLQLGGALFWDTGAAYDRGEFPDLKHDVGIGLRALFPQLDRVVFRLDWAFPLVPAPEVGVTGPWPGNVVFTAEQAFSVPTVSAPSVTN